MRRKYTCNVSFISSSKAFSALSALLFTACSLMPFSAAPRRAFQRSHQQKASAIQNIGQVRIWYVLATMKWIAVLWPVQDSPTEIPHDVLVFVLSWTVITVNVNMLLKPILVKKVMDVRYFCVAALPNARWLVNQVIYLLGHPVTRLVGMGYLMPSEVVFVDVDLRFNRRRFKMELMSLELDTGQHFWWSQMVMGDLWDELFESQSIAVCVRRPSYTCSLAVVG